MEKLYRAKSKSIRNTRHHNQEMVPLTGESLNTVFEVFEDWNQQLSNVDIDFEEPQP